MAKRPAANCRKAKEQPPKLSDDLRKRLLALLAAAYAGGLFFALLAKLLLPRLRGGAVWSAAAGAGLFFLLFFLLTVWRGRQTPPRTYPTLQPLAGRKLPGGLLFLCGGLLLFLPLYLFGDLVADWCRMTMELTVSNVPLWKEILLLAVLPGFLYGTVFEKYAVPLLADCVKESAAVLLGGFLYALTFLDPFHLPAFAVLGIVLAYLTVRTSSYLLQAAFAMLTPAGILLYDAFFGNGSAGGAAMGGVHVTGLGLIFLGFALLLLYGGDRLLDGRLHRFARFLWIFLAAAILLVAGCAVTGFAGGA